MKPKERLNVMAKEVVSILNEIRKSMLDFYIYYETNFKLTERYQP